jgi:hypothetical protein
MKIGLAQTRYAQTVRKPDRFSFPTLSGWAKDYYAIPRFLTFDSAIYVMWIDTDKTFTTTYFFCIVRRLRTMRG